MGITGEEFQAILIALALRGTFFLCALAWMVLALRELYNMIHRREQRALHVLWYLSLSAMCFYLCGGMHI